MGKLAEIGRTRVQPHERFVPIAEGTTRLQILHDTGKVCKPEPASFDPALLKERMGPHFVGVIFEDGSAHRVKEVDNKQIVTVNGKSEVLATFTSTTDKDSEYHFKIVSSHIKAAKVIPVSTWGTDGAPTDMMMNFDPSIQKFHEAPADVISAHLNQRANTLQALLDRGAEVVYTGRNTSPASWRSKDTGLQTAMVFHDQGHVLPDNFNELGAEGIREFREKTAWDKAFQEEEKSVSRLICEPVVPLAEELLQKYWPDSTVRADQMGFSVELPGYTVNDFRDAGKLIVPISKAIDTRLADAHRLVYASDLKDVERFALAEQLRGEFDMDAYERFFEVRTEHDGSSLAEMLHALIETDELRHGFGQVFSASFRKAVGAQFEFSTGFLRGDIAGFGIGPNEARGWKAHRVQDGVVPREQVKENARFLRETVIV